MLRNISAGLMLVAIAGCAAYPSPRSEHVHTAMAPMVKNCDFLGGVHGESVFSHMTIGLEDAKAKAKDQAGFLGATHIVWTDLQSGWHPVAVGRAYRCAVANPDGGELLRSWTAPGWSHEHNYK